ncbi:MAG: dihydroorotate dehydrogenase-like protein [Bacteroidales bacterium]|jgi:dihydroorotate dehydrogenase (fumarate)|nr:dihydroorotate dehydrogenase-like protein [Bacteroidales bacterium]MDD4086095.1 dihydroorotate dehydrogenase-like protein [Bacteroidales bacterium]MDY0086079.1 dihydroorotate dehydrogenase-like protein [Bacteroidales bacterium]
MDLSTKYLGLTLKNPIVVSSSKLTGTLPNIKACAEAGAGAVVLKSLFEEQIIAKTEAGLKRNEMYFWYPEASDYVIEISKGRGVNEYLKLIRDAKAAVDIPIIASINCVSPVEWPVFAKKIEEAGADAIELNVAIFPFDKKLNSQRIEDMYVEILNAVKAQVNIPVSVKMGRYFTNIFAMANRLADAGADGLVLFNRFYNPDVDIASMKVVTDNVFSSPDEKSIPMRWIALLSADGIKCDLAASTGIHYSIGVIKQLLAGATVTQICTTLYQNGIPYISEIINGIQDWMKKNHFKKIDDFRGLVNKKTENSAAFERMQYMRKNFDQH